MRSTGRPNRTRRSGPVYLSLAASAASAAAVLVAGCAGAGSSSGPANTPPATSAAPPASAAASSSSQAAAPSSAPASAPSASGSAAGGGGGAGAGTGCPTSGLRASLGVSQGAAGSIYQEIEFKNTSGSPCTLFGYPGVSLVTGTPAKQVGAAAARSTAASAKLVTLPAGGTANALLRVTEAVNYPTSRCHPVPTTYLQIYPPNQTTPIYLAYQSTGCAVPTVPLLTIGVVQAGTGS